jgi:hypothetical protein
MNKEEKKLNELEELDEYNVRELNIDGLKVDDAKFVSNVTGIGWKKNSHGKWYRIINQVGTVINDEVHQGKNHTTVTLKAGSKVIVDDIRGRINPQYRVTDTNGKIWFVTATNLDFDYDIHKEDKNKENNDKIKENYIYRGGVRVDGTDEVNDVIPERYEMPLSTEEEISNAKKTRRKKRLKVLSNQREEK